MDAQYKATKSALSDFSFLICFVLLLLFVLPGLIYIAYKNITAHHCTVEFYEEKIVTKSGVLNTKENESVFKGVLTVSVSQTMKGKMFDYGTVRADITGRNDLVFEGVANPEGLKQYLLTRKVDVNALNHTITN